MGGIIKILVFLGLLLVGYTLAKGFLTGDIDDGTTVKEIRRDVRDEGERITDSFGDKLEDTKEDAVDNMSDKLKDAIDDLKDKITD